MSQQGIFDRDKITRIKTLLKFNPKGLTITEISQKLKLSRISVSKYLDILLISGQVEMKMYGVAKAFFLSSRVPISAMLSFSSDFILVLDNNLQILQINDNFLTFLGVDKGILLGNSVSHPSLQFLKELPLQTMLEERAEKKEIATEVTTIHDGKQYYFRTKLIPTVFDDGSQGLTIILENVTDNKHSDQVKSFLAAIVESSNEGIIGKSLDGTVISWNHAAEVMFGYKAEEMIGQNIAILVPDNQKTEIPCILERIKLGETITRFETKRMKKNGELIDVLLTISPIRDDKRAIIAISTITRDITDVNKLKDEIRIKHDKLNEIIEFLPDPTFIVDRNKNILGWNKAFEEFTGIKKQDIVGTYALNQLESISGNYRPLLVDFLDRSPEDLPPIYSSVKRTNESISAELYLPEKRTYLWVKASPLCDQDGNFIGGIETIKDISDWKAAEKALEITKDTIVKETEEKIKRLINDNEKLLGELERCQEPLNTRVLLERGLDSCDRRILITDYKGYIKYTSDSMAHLLGATDRKELIDTSIFDTIDPSSSQSLLQLLFTQSPEPISLECSFSIHERVTVASLTACLIKQNENIVGFVIQNQGCHQPYKVEVMADTPDKKNTLQDGFKTQLLSQILLLTPIFAIMTGSIELP
jgi:PAS domain S-box-containing protein